MAATLSSCSRHPLRSEGWLLFLLLLWCGSWVEDPVSRTWVKEGHIGKELIDSDQGLPLTTDYV